MAATSAADDPRADRRATSEWGLAVERVEVVRRHDGDAIPDSEPELRRLAEHPLIGPTLLLLPGAVGALDGGGKAMTAASALPWARTRPLTAPDIAGAKGAQTPLVMVTAYDAPSARVVDAAGVDMILVGDTLAMVVLGYDNTLQVSTDDMAHHVGAVARTHPHALIVGDLPWMSYHVSREETVRNAAQLIRAGAGAIKLEGGRKRLDAISAILDAEIPVMGHLGLTPQSIHAIGGFKVQGKQLDAARRIVDDAVALAEAGCFAIVLECVPDGVARMVTDAVGVPTIGIGAGRHCDGQVLVYHDLLGFEDRLHPRFVRRYAELGADATAAVARFADDVRRGTFPSSDETYHMTDQLDDAMDEYATDDVTDLSETDQDHSLSN